MDTKAKRGDKVDTTVCYERKIALCLALDAEWSRKGIMPQEPEDESTSDAHGTAPGGTASSTPFAEVFQRHRRACVKYHKAVKDHLRDIAQVNGLTPVPEFSPDLFQPHCFVQFGRSDCLTWTLLDDFDPVHHLSAHCRSTVEGVSVALLPTLESLGADHPWIVSISSLLESTQPEAGDRQNCLLMFTKFKLDGQLCLGAALHFQQAVFRAMSARIGQMMRSLQAAPPPPEGKLPLYHHGETRDDIAGLKATLLDLQGTEEVGLLIATSNYSLAAAVLMSLERLTINDIDPGGARLGPIFHGSEAHVEIHRQYRKFDSACKAASFAELVQDNHVFRWTNSILAVEETAYADPDAKPIHGYIEATAELRVSPGHQRHLQGSLRNVPFGVKTTAERGGAMGGAERPRDESTVPRTRLADYDRCLTGAFDLLYPVRRVDDVSEDYLVQTKAFVRAHQYIVTECAASRKEGDIVGSGRDIVGLTTRITVPVPRTPDMIGQDELGPKHCAPLCALLLRVKEAIYRGSTQATTAPSAISFNALLAIPRTYGLPVTLRRSIEYLYQNFATALGNPLLFDTLLDLYDTFLSLFRALVYELPLHLNERQANPSNTPEIAEGSINQIAAYVDCLRNAVEQRLNTAYPEIPVRDMGIDFRGGLTQLIFAGDAVMKCGIGLLRNNVLGARDDMSRVGVISQTALTPGIRCVLMRIGIEGPGADKMKQDVAPGINESAGENTAPAGPRSQRGVRLGYLDVDVAHLMAPSSWTEYLHEAFHLIFDFCFNDMVAQFAAGRTEKQAELFSERLSEIFVHLLQHALLTGQNSERYIALQVSRLSDSMRCSTGNLHNTIVEVTEVMICLFIVQDIFQATRPEGFAASPDPWKRLERLQPSPVKRFVSFLDTYLPYIREFEQNPALGQYDRVRYYMRGSFEDVYAQVREHLPILWTKVLRVYRMVMVDDVRVSMEETEAACARIDRETRQALDRTAAVGALPDVKDGMQNSLLLICSLMRNYLLEIPYDTQGRRRHLYRNPRTAEIEFPPGREYNYFLLDRGAASRFCSHPDRRSARLGMQICTLKTCWGLSSRMRGRRFELILKAHLQ